MQIRYSQHFQERQVLRNMPSGLAEEVFFDADDHFNDSLIGTYVAVRRVTFGNVDRNVAVIYRRDSQKSYL